MEHNNERDRCVCRQRVLGSSEWASRPPDERYTSVQALYEAARARRNRIEERTIDTVAFRTEAVDTDALALRDATGREAAMTNWSFEQLAGIAGAPPKYLRTLPATIASDAINYGLRRQRREQHQLLLDRDDPWTVAITSPRYAGAPGEAARGSTSWPRIPPGICRSASGRVRR
jgi:hypothetical protein